MHKRCYEWGLLVFCKQTPFQLAVIGTLMCINFKLYESTLLLSHYHTMPHFDTLKIYSYGKHCEKRRKQAISLFLTMFSTLYGTYFLF